MRLKKQQKNPQSSGRNGRTFLLLLALSTMLWYVAKLSYTYDADIPVRVSAEGVKFKVQCHVEGTGYQIFLYKYLNPIHLYVKMDDLHTSPSRRTEGALTPDRYTLQDMISKARSDLKIRYLKDVPDIVPPEGSKP